MKIAYIACVSTQESGVKKKIDTQIATWRSCGHDVHSFFLTMKKAEAFTSYTLWPRFNLMNPLVNCVKDLLAFNPDVIYLRDDCLIAFNLNLLHLFKKKIIIEINGDYRNEAKSKGKKNFLEKIAYLLCIFTLPFFYKRIGGMVCVTEELAKGSFYSCSTPKIVIPNAITVENFSLLKKHGHKDFKKTRLFFLGSSGQPWHGLDKMILLLKKLGSDFTLDVVGPDRTTVERSVTIPDNVVVHGHLKHSEYAKVISNAHIAVSTLALHRAGLNEACPLKSREYLAQGFPTIIAYDDPAFHGKMPDFILQLPNHEDLFKDEASVEAVREFCLKNRDTVVSHSDVKPYIDTSIWEAERLAFFQKL